MSLLNTARPCGHSWTRQGHPCVFRRCIDTADAAYARALHEAARAEAEEAAKTAEDHLVAELHELWAQHPGLRDLIGALGRYAETQCAS